MGILCGIPTFYKCFVIKNSKVEILKNQTTTSTSTQSEAAGGQTSTTAEQTQNVSVADEILKLKNLMESGVITAEEFEAQKKKLLRE